MAMTVTATQGGSTGASLLLRVYVITGAKPAASQTGGSVHTSFATNTATWTLSITTTAASNVYGAGAPSPAGQAPVGSNATIADNVDDTTNGITYVTFKALNVTGAATTRGFTTGAGAGTLALQEILAQTTLAEDASAPAAVDGHGTTNLTVTTASFTPPAGALIVAVVSSSGGTGVTTMTVSGGGLTWTEKAHDNTSGLDYAGVWIADGPAGTPNPVIIRPVVQPPAPLRPPPGQVINAPVAYRPVVTLSGVGTLAAGPGVGSFPVVISPVVQPPAPARPPPGQVIGLTVAAFTSAATLSGSGTLAATYTVTGLGQAVIQAVTVPLPVLVPGAPSSIVGAAPTVTFTVGASLSGSGTLAAGPGVGGFPVVIRAVPPLPPNPPQPPPGQVITGPAAALLGAATLSGFGTLAAAPFFSGAATLSGVGTLAAGPGVGGFPTVISRVPPLPPNPPAPPPSRVLTGPAAIFTGAATLSGQGTLAGAPTFTAAATLSGSGTLAAAPAFTVAVTLSGQGTLSAGPVFTVTATLSGSGTLAALWTLRLLAVLSGVGTLGGAGQLGGVITVIHLGQVAAGEPHAYWAAGEPHGRYAAGEPHG